MSTIKLSIQKVGFIVLACTIGLNGNGFALDPTNSVQDGRIITGGNYYNTAGNKTTFINSGPGGLWLKAGSTVRGLEVNTSGALTNNGGTVHLYAPGQVVRVDGNINVNANTNGQGAALGNGGNVFIDSAYLFQNGNITANGINGGLVQVHVDSMTLGSGASIQAKGLGGAGGVVAINSSGPVDLRRGSVIDTSGRVVGSFDTNLIDIEGSLVNNDATLRADGVAAQFGGSRGGTIRLVATGQSDLQNIKNILQTGTQNPVGDNTAPTISASERTFILQRTNGLINSHEGDIALNRDTQNTTNPSYTSLVSANATGGQTDSHNDYSQSVSSRSGDGGTVLMTAMHNVVNQGRILANGANGQSTSINGGNGGTISILAQNSIVNSQGRMEANGGAGANSAGTGGNGGNGGLMAFGYNNAMTNTGGLYTDGGIGGSGSAAGKGGNGGLVVFSGDTNPTGNGSIDVIARAGGNNNLNLGGKSGTIVSPTPGTLGAGQVYFQQGYVGGQLVRTRATEQTRPVELLTHAENLILLTKNGGSTTVSENLFDRLLQATYRSVEDPTGTLGQARTEIINKNTPTSPYVFRNLVLSSSRNNLSLDMTHPWGNDGGFGSGELIFPSPLSMGEGFSTLNTLNIVNDGSISTQYLQGGAADSPYEPTNFWLIGRNSNNLGGGRLSALANGNVANINVFGTTGVASGGSVNIAALGTVDNAARLTAESPLHGGSIILKAVNDVINNETIYYSVGTMSANGGVMGGTIQILPLHDFNYTSGVFLTSIASNGALQGGIINVRAGHNSVISSSSFGANNSITANGTSSTLGRGGFIHINAGNSNIHDVPITASGGLTNGTVLFTVGDN